MLIITRPPFIAFGQAREQHLHFFSILLDAAAVIQDDDRISVPALELGLPAQVFLGGQPLLDWQGQTGPLEGRRRARS